MQQDLNLYLSPHYDDAILSCGGLIHAQRRTGRRVDVLTLCADLPDPVPKSTLACQYLAQWSKSGDGMAKRRAENAAVLSGWGVQNRECDTPDAIFRTVGGTPYYQTREDLFRNPNNEDAVFLLTVWEEWLKQLAGEEKSIRLYAPLGIGGHVDHVLAGRLGQRMGQSGWTVWFYEDYPYVELESNGVKAAQARFGSCKWVSQTIAINVQAKINALRAYHTQIGPVFGCDADLDRRVKSFTAETACAISYGERLRAVLAPSGRRLRLWRFLGGYHAHAERIWAWSSM